MKNYSSNYTGNNDVIICLDTHKKSPFECKQSFTNYFHETFIFELFVNKNLVKIECKQSFTNFFHEFVKMKRKQSFSLLPGVPTSF